MLLGRGGKRRRPPLRHDTLRGGRHIEERHRARRRLHRIRGIPDHVRPVRVALALTRPHRRGMGQCRDVRDHAQHPAPDQRSRRNAWSCPQLSRRLPGASAVCPAFRPARSLPSSALPSRSASAAPLSCSPACVASAPWPAGIAKTSPSSRHRRTNRSDPPRNQLSRPAFFPPLHRFPTSAPTSPVPCARIPGVPGS